jgi:hypothetical protein
VQNQFATVRLGLVCDDGRTVARPCHESQLGGQGAEAGGSKWTRAQDRPAARAYSCSCAEADRTPRRLPVPTRRSQWPQTTPRLLSLSRSCEPALSRSTGWWACTASSLRWTRQNTTHAWSCSSSCSPSSESYTSSKSTHSSTRSA